MAEKKDLDTLSKEIDELLDLYAKDVGGDITKIEQLVEKSMSIFNDLVTWITSKNPEDAKKALSLAEKLQKELEKLYGQLMKDAGLPPGANPRDFMKVEDSKKVKEAREGLKGLRTQGQGKKPDTGGSSFGGGSIRG